MTAIKHLIKYVIFGLLLAAGWMVYYANTTLALSSLPFEFTLKHGSSLKSVSKQLTDAGVLREPWSFTVLVRAFGKAGEVKAGNYLLENNLTPLQLFHKITKGDVTQSEIAVIEGWTFKQLRMALDAHPGILHETAGLSEQEVMSRLGASEHEAEGMFFPDTYYFSSGMSDLSILKRAYQNMQNHLTRLWNERDPGIPYKNSYEALIMASIVEKETAKASERSMIAAVFINRLRLGMRLQTDPTVIYGLGENFDGNLHKQDLIADTAYNTYTRTGMPPTPIALPGLEAIHAALHPAKSSALYFVAKGEGAHQFSSSLEEHNRAVLRYQLNGKGIKH